MSFAWGGAYRAKVRATYQVRLAPLSSCRPGRRHLGSLFSVLRVWARSMPDRLAVRADDRGRELAAGRLVHERHELVREARHGAADADAADVRAAADAVDPAAFGHVALDHRAPAAELHDALRGVVLGREVALLVVAGAVATLVHRLAEQPRRAQLVVERDHRRLAGGLIQQVRDGLGEVVALDRAARHADDRQAGLALPVPPEIVRNPHGTGGIACHGVDSAVRGARADGENGEGFGREPVEPLARRHRLAGQRVVAEPGPVALTCERLVRYRPLDDEDEGLQLAAICLPEPLQEVVRTAGRAAFEVDERPVDRDFGQPRQRAQRDLFDARLRRSGERNGVPVAAQPGIDPQHVDQGVFGRDRLGGWHGRLPVGACSLRPHHAVDGRPCRSVRRKACPIPPLALLSTGSTKRLGCRSAREFRRRKGGCRISDHPHAGEWSSGLVQGVGFRPFVWREATARGLRGFVGNDADGVVLEVEGPPDDVSALVAALSDASAAGARRSGHSCTTVPVVGDAAFAIRDSDVAGARRALVSPDTATCADCLRELHDPGRPSLSASVH